MGADCATERRRGRREACAASYHTDTVAIEQDVQRAYNEIMRSFVEDGRAPHYVQLAKRLDVDVEEARRLQAEAVKYGVGAWTLPDTDVIESFAPFYNGPTNTTLKVDGETRWNAQCFLEGTAARFVFPGKVVQMESLCLDCGESTVVTMRDEDILDIDPDTAVGIMNHPLNPELRAGLTGSFF